DRRVCALSQWSAGSTSRRLGQAIATSNPGTLRGGGKIRREYRSEYLRAIRRGIVITKSVLATIAGPARKRGRVTAIRRFGLNCLSSACTTPEKRNCGEISRWRYAKNSPSVGFFDNRGWSFRAMQTKSSLNNVSNLRAERSDQRSRTARS